MRSEPVLTAHPTQTAALERADMAAPDAESFSRLTLAQTLLEAERVELAQVPGQTIDPGMKQMKQLCLTLRNRSGSVIEGLRKRVALAPDVGRLVHQSVKDPGGVDPSGRTRLPEREKEFLEKVGRVLGAEAILVGNTTGGSSDVGRCEPDAGGHPAVWAQMTGTSGRRDCRDCPNS